MDSETWQAMTPRERDILIAEKVLHIPVLAYIGDKHPHQGNHQWLDDPANYPHVTDNGERLSYWHEPDTDGVVWSPTTTDHPQVIAKMRADGWAYCVGGAATGPIGASFEFGRPHDPDHVSSYRTVVKAATEGLAICESALRAIGVLS